METTKTTNLVGDGKAGVFTVDNETKGFKKIHANCGYLFWKTKRAAIAELEIPKGATIVRPTNSASIFDKKLRTDQAKVVNITDIEDKPFSPYFCTFHSMHDDDFRYRLGEVARPDFFDKSLEEQCTGGIHFFATKREAVNY